MYKISEYSKQQAKRLGVKIYPSEKKNKKIDVYSHDDSEYLGSIGDIRYKDYPTYLKEDGEEIARIHQYSYHRRHHKERDKIGTPGYYALNILW
jgi:hypothetical protein